MVSLTGHQHHFSHSKLMIEVFYTCLDMEKLEVQKEFVSVGSLRLAMIGSIRFWAKSVKKLDGNDTNKY